jgi:hypothetical protein
MMNERVIEDSKAFFNNYTRKSAQLIRRLSYQHPTYTRSRASNRMRVSRDEFCVRRELLAALPRPAVPARRAYDSFLAKLSLATAIGP